MRGSLSPASANSRQLPYGSGAGRDPTGGMEILACRASALRRMANDTSNADSRVNSPSGSDDVPSPKIKHLRLRSHLIRSIDSQDLSQLGLLCPPIAPAGLACHVNSVGLGKLYLRRVGAGLSAPSAASKPGTAGPLGATSGPRTTGSQRTTTVIAGPSSAQLTGQVEADVAGHRDRSGLSDTEEVTPTPRGAGQP
jgi:hypothetical protein